MERDFVALQCRYINQRKYTLLCRTREDSDFYALMGRFFGSRAIAKTLGMPMYDDPHRIWIIILNAEHHPIACTSLEHKPNSQVAALKSAWVEPDERNQGLYDWMFAARLQLVEQLGIQKLTSTTTTMSQHTHERYGFQIVGKRGKYVLYEKKLGETYP